MFNKGFISLPIRIIRRVTLFSKIMLFKCKQSRLYNFFFVVGGVALSTLTPRRHRACCTKAFSVRDREVENSSANSKVLSGLTGYSTVWPLHESSSLLLYRPDSTVLL